MKMKHKYLMHFVALASFRWMLPVLVSAHWGVQALSAVLHSVIMHHEAGKRRNGLLTSAGSGGREEEDS